MTGHARRLSASLPPRRPSDAVLQPAVPADQVADHCRACRPANGSRASRSRARSTWPRASGSARARCARRSTNWRPRTWWCAARARAPSSRRTPSSTSSTASCSLVPDSGDADSEGPAARDRRLQAPARAAPTSRARCTCAPATPVLQVRRVLAYRGAPTILDDTLAARRAVQGPDGRAPDAHWHGPMYALFETEFGVRMVRAEEKIRAVLPDAAQAALLAVSPRHAAAERRAASLTPTATRRWNCAAASTAPTAHHYRNDARIDQRPLAPTSPTRSASAHAWIHRLSSACCIAIEFRVVCSLRHQATSSRLVKRRKPP